MMMPFPIQHQRKALSPRSNSDFQAAKSKRGAVDSWEIHVPDLMIAQPGNTVDPFALMLREREF